MAQRGEPLSQNNQEILPDSQVSALAEVTEEEGNEIRGLFGRLAHERAGGSDLQKFIRELLKDESI